MQNRSVAIMQPYFFPYIGYFQLIGAVDCYVNLDHVSFMKRSYMTRNVLKDDTQFCVHVLRGSQNVECNKTFVDFENNYIKKTIKTIDYRYSKSANYKTIMDSIVYPAFSERICTISEFNVDSIKQICNYLDIQTPIIETSSQFDNGMKSSDLLIETTKQLGGTMYINAIGGQRLYEKEAFAKHSIDLKFLRMDNVELENPYLSILHQLFVYSKDHVKKQLSHYSLV